MKFIQSIFLETIRLPLIGIWFLMGWRMDGNLPKVPKMVITGAPHTSNWDFLVFLIAILHERRRARVTIKHTLFFPPLGWILTALGGIPINRTKSGNVVELVKEMFDSRKELAMVFSPEGTRSYKDFWRTGFYYAAIEAKVPIVCAAVNYKDKRVYCHLVFEPTGDLESDFEKIRIHQEKYGSGLYPEKGNKVAIRRQGNRDKQAAPTAADME